MIFISHRLSTAVDADRILLMDNGEIKESGTHGELMARGRLYAEMFTIQASQYKEGMKGETL
jgi:ATP-binding cassette subfamily B protein